MSAVSGARLSVLFVRMSLDERETCRQLALAIGISESELVRQLVRQRAGQDSMLAHAESPRAAKGDGR